MKTRNILLASFVAVITIIVGSFGTFFTLPSLTNWYSTLTKPSFNPPNWLFAPVWIILFALMGIAAFLVWLKGWDKQKVRLALTIFVLQFVLNLTWTLIFFGLHNPLLGLFEIILLWLSIVATIWSFWKVSRWATFLLLPYLLWVSFALVLNFAIWKLN